MRRKDPVSIALGASVRQILYFYTMENSIFHRIKNDRKLHCGEAENVAKQPAAGRESRIARFFPKSYRIASTMEAAVFGRFMV